MIRQYFTSTKFRQPYAKDWVLVIILLTYFFAVAEKAKPFSREFVAGDSRISHPFAEQERVTDQWLYVLAVYLPMVVTIIVCWLTKTWDKYTKLHRTQVALVSLLLSAATTGVITDILKCWIANPRPDFLSRCGGSSKMSKGKLYTMEACTAKLGELYLYDGMKSTPSGHSSLLFCGLGWLVLFLWGHYSALTTGKPAYMKYAFALGPMMLALYVGLSRVQDYRHHNFDIMLGGIIGGMNGLIGYLHYYHAPWSSSPTHLVVDEHIESSLPK